MHDKVKGLLENIIQVNDTVPGQEDKKVEFLDHIMSNINEQVGQDITIDPSNEEVDRILETQSKQDLMQNLS